MQNCYEQILVRYACAFIFMHITIIIYYYYYLYAVLKLWYLLIPVADKRPKQHQHFYILKDLSQIARVPRPNPYLFLHSPALVCEFDCFLS